MSGIDPDTGYPIINTASVAWYAAKFIADNPYQTIDPGLSGPPVLPEPPKPEDFEACPVNTWPDDHGVCRPGKPGSNSSWGGFIKDFVAHAPSHIIDAVVSDLKMPPITAAIGGALLTAASEGANAAQTFADNTVLSVQGTALPPLGSAVASVAGVSSAIGGGAAGAAAAAESVAASSTGTILGDVGNWLTGAKNAVSGVLGPISDAIHSVNDAVQGINNDLIKPIVGPIKAIIDSYDALHKELAVDLHDGLSGLLRLPDDIANALDSVDASLQRALSQMGRLFVDGLSDAYAKTAPLVGAAGFKDLSDSLSTTHKLHTSLDEPYDPIHLPQDIDAEKLADYLRNLVSQLRATEGWWSPFVHLFATLLDAVPIIGGFLLASVEAGKDAGRSAFQGTHLGTGDIMAALDRDILDLDSARMELRRQGLSDERIEVILRLSDLQPSLGDTLQWWRRGFIDDTVRNQLLKELSVPDRHVDLYADASYSPPAFNDVLEELVKAAMGDTGLDARDFTQSAPDALRAAALRGGISVEAADAAWRSHWASLPASQAVLAYFRGYVSWDQARSMMRAANLPDGLHTLYRDLLRPRLERRTVGQFVKAGVMSVGEVEQEFRDQGWREIDIARWMRLIEQDSQDSGAAPVEPLHGLSVQTIMGLYDAGTIDRSHALDLLVQLGAGHDAAELQLELHDVLKQQREREAARKRIIARTRSGALTPAQAQAKLAELGLTAEEVAQTLDEIEAALQTADKQPSDSVLAQMMAVGIITPEDFIDALLREGYSPQWAAALLQLAQSKPAKPQGVL